MQTIHGRKFDQNIAHDLLQISPLRKFDLMTMVNTGIEVTNAETGKRYAVTNEAVEPTM